MYRLDSCISRFEMLCKSPHHSYPASFLSRPEETQTKQRLLIRHTSHRAKHDTFKNLADHANRSFINRCPGKTYLVDHETGVWSAWCVDTCEGRPWCYVLTKLWSFSFSQNSIGILLILRGINDGVNIHPQKPTIQIMLQATIAYVSPARRPCLHNLHQKHIESLQQQKSTKKTPTVCTTLVSLADRT